MCRRGAHAHGPTGGRLRPHRLCSCPLSHGEHVNPKVHGPREGSSRTPPGVIHAPAELGLRLRHFPPPNPAGSVSPNLGREQRRAPPVLGSAGRGRPRVRTHTQGAAQKPQTAERPPTPVRTAPRPGTAPGGLPPRTPRPRPLGRHRHLELRVAPWDTRGVGPWTQAKQARGTGRRRRRAGGEDGHGPDGRRPGARVTSGGRRVLRPHLPDLAHPKASQGWPCPDSTVTHSRTRPRERSRGRGWLRARGGCPVKTTCQPPSPGSPPWTARRLLP